MLKKIIAPLFLLFIINTLQAQNKADKTTPPVQDDKVYNLFDIQETPKFPGGEQAMLKFIADNTRYPDGSVTGTVAVRFVVMKDGSISNIEVVKDNGAGAEIVRVIGLMPKWTPGQLYGNPVNVSYVLPVRICLK